MHVTAQHIQLVSSSRRAHSALIYFPVPQSLFHLAVTDGACVIKRRRKEEEEEEEEEEGEEKKNNLKSLLPYTLSWAIKYDWTFHGGWKTGKLLEHLRSSSPGERTAPEGIPLSSMRTFTRTSYRPRWAPSIAVVFVAWGCEHGYIWNPKCQTQWLNR